MTVAELRAKQKLARENYQTGATKALTLTTAEEIATHTTAMKAIEDDITLLDSQIEIQANAEKIAAKAKADLEPVNRLQNATDDSTEIFGATKAQAAIKALTIPATASRYGAMKAFPNTQEGEKEAFAFGMWGLATLGRNIKAMGWCEQHGLGDLSTFKAMSEGVNASVGYLVPPEFATRIIDLKETYGVFKKNSYIEPMTRDTKTIARRISGLTAYGVAENAAATASALQFNQVQLTAKKAVIYAVNSMELNEDTVINFGDLLAQEIAYGFSVYEDNCGFNGDGSATYNNIVGVRQAFLNLSATRANIAGVVITANTAWSGITLADLEDLRGLLPEYPGINPKWYCSKRFYNSVMVRLLLAQGGSTATEAQTNMITGKYYFLGEPVVIAQAMPQSATADTITMFYGDLPMGSTYGERKEIRLAVSTEAGSLFENDQIAVKGVTRFDIKVHDVGNATSVTADKKPGPLVGLLMHA